MGIFSYLKKIFASQKRIIGITDLRRGLKNNEFVFYYQPEWDLKTGHIVGLEALMRWETSKGIVPPNEFIPALEKTGVINEFTPFLLNQTLKDLKTIHQIGFDDLFMSINISVSQLHDVQLPEIIRSTLEAYDISPEKLECEITETMQMDQSELEQGILQQLRDMGIKLSIDDFGSGQHASLSQITRIQTQKLKVDREFVQTLFDKPANETVLRTIIGLGHSLGLIVLAEGIETTEQEKWLRDNGCDYGQGFWYSRPLPIHLLLSFLEKLKTQPILPSSEDEDQEDQDSE